MTLLSLLLWLGGCKQKAQTPTAAPAAGPDVNLQYPVIIFSRTRHLIEVRTDAKELTTTTVLRNDIFDGMQLVDSSNSLYVVQSQRPAEKVPGWFKDSTGNTPYRIEMHLKFSRKVSLDEAKQLLLEVIKDPQSYWSQSHYGNGTAVKKVQGAKSLSELIKACRESSKWL